MAQLNYGHDVDGLVDTLSNMRALKGPQLLHDRYPVKAKAYAPAEKDPIGYHGVAEVSTQAHDALPKKARRLLPSYFANFWRLAL